MRTRDLSPPSFLASLTRSQLASLAATGVDFSTLVFSVEFLKIWYVAATALGAFFGAITNFLLGRYWSFAARDGGMRSQAIRYAMVSGGSLLLNSLGVYVLTDHLKIQYVGSKAIVAFLIGILFNFPLHRHFVFR